MLAKLDNLGAKGINTDIDPWDLPAEYLTDGYNFRVTNGGVESHGSYEIDSVAPTNYEPGYGMVNRTRQGLFLILCGQTKVYKYFEAVYEDITPDNLQLNPGEEVFWSGCVNGGVAILNNKKNFPYYWAGQGTLIDLPWDVAASSTWLSENKRCDVIREHKNILIAMNLHEEDEYPDSFRWSHPADENGIPHTWDPTNTAGLAGKQALGGDGGAIIDGLSLRDSFVIYSERAINVLDLSGDEFVWSRRELSSSIGLLSKDCVVDVNGTHFLMTSGDIVTCDGSSIKSIAHNTIRELLKQSVNIDNTDAAFAVKIDAHKEVWFCVPEANSKTASIVFIYNWQDSTWAIKHLEVGTAYIVVTPRRAVPVETWDTVQGVWDDSLNKWSDTAAADSFELVPYGINKNKELQLLEPVSPVALTDTMVQRTDITLTNKLQVTLINKLYPHVNSKQPLYVQIGSQDRPGDAVRWQQAVLFDPANDRKIDVRTTGTLHAYRILSHAKDNFKFSGLDVIYEATGIR